MLKDSGKIDALVRKAVFGSEDEKAHARWMIWEMGQQAGVRPASIHELYLARGRGEVPAFTTPAMNVRIMAYDTGRAIFRAAMRLDAGAIICEIARSEIAYTDQRPAEYVAVMTAAALREGFTGPLFIFLGNLPPNPHAVAIMEAAYLTPDLFFLLALAAGISHLQRWGAMTHAPPGFLLIFAGSH